MTEMTNGTTADTIDAALAKVVKERKPRKAKAPAKVEAGRLPVDGDVSMELQVDNVPKGYVHMWLSERDIGRFSRRGLIPVEWGNKWGCRPTFCGKEGQRGEVIIKNELALYLESIESREERIANDPSRLKHAVAMATVARARRVDDGLTMSWAGDISSMKE